MMDFAIDAITISRAIQLVLSIIALGLNASVVDWFNKHDFVTLPGYASFLVFCSVWTILLVLPYTTFCPRYFPKYINRYSSLAIELTTTIFWFCGFIAGAAYLGKLDRCGGLLCSNARAGVVFAAIIFVCCCITAYFPFKYTFFDQDNHELGERNHTLALSGALKFKAPHVRETVDNLSSNQSSLQNTGGQFKSTTQKSLAVMKTRIGNIARGLKAKAGHGKSPERSGNRSQMSEYTRSDNMV